MSSGTTITVGADIRERLGHLQLMFRRARGGRAVGTSETVRFLIDALDELDTKTYLRLLDTHFGQAGTHADERDHHGQDQAEGENERAGDGAAAAVPARL